ncbi:hypothetical protein ceV_185 [Chrysochromulina ericina virus CeV-01B]|uniref:Uncharacterized protein n=1 Tax=Chrysochromulina ericina virus CeV-01B TaxID=3070830 RepID=A0A0N9R0A0_9VIRU|nr:hypothetical protein ceV_185 [Chrysochromulina ericina virus]ALH23091.1 hypothetical protein ceV_185 [Chrysochromulina ericina virus CeV-01B]
MSSGFQLPGSLFVTQTNLSDVGDSMNRVIQSEIEEVARTSNILASTNFAFYIQADYNINNHISYEPSSSADGLDDAYAMSAITVDSATATNAVIELQTADGVPVQAGYIDAQNRDQETLGNFPVTLTVSVSNTGEMSSTITITGEGVVSSISENDSKAQVVYWSGIESTPIVDATSVDVHSSTLTVADLLAQYQSQLQSIESQYNNINMIETWRIEILGIDAGVSNPLSQHARAVNKAGSQSVFSPGDKIVCQNTFSYEVVINDYQEIAPTTIVSSTNVYGVLQQI